MYRIARVYNAGMIVCIGRRAHPLACWTVLALMGLVPMACSKASNINPDDAARVRKIDTPVGRPSDSHRERRGRGSAFWYGWPPDSERTTEGTLGCQDAAPPCRLCRPPIFSSSGAAWRDCGRPSV